VFNPGTIRVAVLAMGMAAMLLAGTACSDDSGNEPKAAAVTATVSPEGSVTVVARDNRFEVKDVAVPANTPVTLVFQNQGSAVHNFKVTNVKSADGKEIETELLAGKKSETISFTIDKPGSYTFQCDTHPAEMRGKLTVQ
jgi:plastocyanin